MKKSHRTLLFITLLTLGIASLATVAWSQDSAYLLTWYTFQSGNYIQPANEDSSTSGNYTLHSAIGPPSAAQSSDGTHILYSGVAMPADTAIPTATPNFTPTPTDVRIIPTATSASTFTEVPTATPIHTETFTAMPTVIPSSTHTPTLMPTSTDTPITPSATSTATLTEIPTTNTPEDTPTVIPSSTHTPTFIPTSTDIPITPSATSTATLTEIPTTNTPEDTPTVIPSSTHTPTFIPTSTDTPITPIATSTSTLTEIPTSTPEDAPTVIPSSTHTPTLMPTAIDTPITPIATSIATLTEIPTSTPEDTPTIIPSSTHTPTLMPTSTETLNELPTSTPEDTPIHTGTATETVTEIFTETPTAILPSTHTPTIIPTLADTPTIVPTQVIPPTYTPLPPQPTHTLLPPQPTHTPLPIPTPTNTPTNTPTLIPTATSEMPCYELDIHQQGEGELPIPSPDRSIGCRLDEYHQDEFITLNAQPEPGWKVEGWQGTDQNELKDTKNTFIMPSSFHKIEVIYRLTRVDSNCRNLTPPGDPLPASCLVGIVYLDGTPIEGIDVEITNAAGESKIVPTEIKENSADPRPHYRIALDDPAFRIQIGDSITLRVIHENFQEPITWVAQSHRQQVDIPLFSSVNGSSSPIVTIGSISTENGELKARGKGASQQENGEIMKYQWFSDKNGLLGEAETLLIPLSDLEPGHHQLSFQVQDSQGIWSAPVITDIHVAHESPVKWVMLLYLAGDYDDGNQQWDVFQSVLKKLKRIENPALRIVVQVDGADKPTQRWIIDPSQSVAPVMENIGEMSMDDPQTLIDFIQWGQAQFPTDNYYLAIADHGQAVRGIAWDTTSDLIDNGITDDSAFMSVKELGEALNSSSIAPINVLHLDACSMNLIEVAYEIGEGAEFMISSQYLGWDYFAYDRYAEKMTGTTTPSELSKQIVETYAGLVEDDGSPYTISALNMHRLSVIITQLDGLAGELTEALNSVERSSKIDKDSIEDTRLASQTFDSQGDLENDEYDLYMDIRSWVNNLLEQVDDDEIQKKATDLLTELDAFVLANKASSGPVRTVDALLEEASGLSIFYPRSRFYASHKQYMDDELFKFSQDSSWKNFLKNSIGVVQPGDTVTPVPGPSAPEPPPTPLPTETPTPTPTVTPYYHYLPLVEG